MDDDDNENPRLITFAECQRRYGTGKFIDLGMVSLRDAAIYGRTRPLIPYADGRLIKSISYLPPTPVLADIGSMTWFFQTPNTYDGGDLSNLSPPGPFGGGGPSGYGVISQAGNNYDSDAVARTVNDANLQGGNTSLNGDSGNPLNASQICDCGPLIFAPGPADSGLMPMGTWQADHAYCLHDYILDGNSNIQFVTTNGVSGSTEPTWGLSGETSDGTVTWTFESEQPTSDVSIHVIVEVIEGISPMPKYPASLEWISQPVDTVSGETMTDIVVLVKDQDGDPYTFFPLSLQLDTSGDGNIGANATPLDKATGLVTFTGIAAGDPGTYILRCRMIMPVVVDPIFSEPFDITAP